MLDQFQQASRAADTGEFWAVAAAVGSFAAGCGFMAWRRFAALRALERLPRASLLHAGTGYVELQGPVAALPGPETVSPLSGVRCLWWRYTIEEYDGDDEDGSNWSTLESGTSEDLFLLRDMDGECLVDPAGAAVVAGFRRAWRGNTPRPLAIPADTSGWSSGRYRYSEQLLRPGDFLYAAGWLRSTAVTASEERRDVASLLADWKRNRATLLRRFDTDGNGEIDLTEWEAARAAALAEVRRQHAAAGLDRPTLVLCAPDDGRPYLLSTTPRETLLRHRGYVAHFLSALAAGLGGATLFALWARLH